MSTMIPRWTLFQLQMQCVDTMVLRVRLSCYDFSWFVPVSTHFWPPKRPLKKLLVRKVLTACDSSSRMVRQEHRAIRLQVSTNPAQPERLRISEKCHQSVHFLGIREQDLFLTCATEFRIVIRCSDHANRISKSCLSCDKQSIGA